MNDQPSITCPRCGMTSYNPNDIREGYCGNCHDWTAGEDVNTRTQLVTFLSNHGLAEEHDGYGHATCEDVADHLLAHFNIEPR